MITKALLLELLMGQRQQHIHQAMRAQHETYKPEDINYGMG